MSLAVVQHNSAIHGNGIPGAITLGGAPTSGNLLIAFLGTNLATSGVTINTSGWTQFDGEFSSDGTTTQGVALYRYVQPGDGATLPAFFTAGSTYFAHSVYEISGVVGTWDDDFLISSSYNNTLTADSALATFTATANGSMGLTFFGSYNGSSNPSISGTWTLDDAANNNSNYGSVGCAHRALSAGDALDGSWTGGTSAPLGGFVMILTGSNATNIQPRHFHRQTANSSGHPGSITVPWVPKIGNLVLAYIAWGHGNATNPTINATDWTQFKAQIGNSTDMLIGLYRYVQSGDTAALPALTTAGTDFYGIAIMEVTNVSGTFGTDHVSDKSGTQGSGSTQTTTADTTTSSNQLGVIAYANYDANGLFSLTGGFTIGMQGVDFSDYGNWGIALQMYPTASSTVQSTITPASTTTQQTYIQSIFTGASGGGPTTYTPSLTESMSLADVVSDTNSDTAVLSESVTLSDTPSASVSRASPNVVVVVIG